MFWNRETPKNFFTFQETELSFTAEKKAFLYFLNKKIFFYLGKGIIRPLAYLELEPYSEPGYTQYPIIFKTRSIFRTMVYSQPWHIQNQKHIYNVMLIQSTVKHLRWNVKQLRSALSYILHIELFSISRNSLTLYFSYISRSNFPSSKRKKNPLLKSSLYFRK